MKGQTWISDRDLIISDKKFREILHLIKEEFKFFLLCLGTLWGQRLGTTMGHLSFYHLSNGFRTGSKL